MATLKPIIKIKNLNVTYFLGKPNEVKALQNINLEVYTGEFVIFFGPSGCGKSTLLYSVAGLETNAIGKIEVGDKNIAELNSKELEEFHQKKTGMIFQAYYLINSLSVLKNVILPQIAIGGNKKDRKKKAMDLLKNFGVKEQADKLPNELSGGQQQRIAISRSLMNDPEILLADEPVGNLDSKSADDVMKLLKELNEKQKKTIVLVTHNPAFLNIAHRVFYIKDGMLVETKVNKAVNDNVVSPKEEMSKVSISKELELLARTFSSVTGSPGNLLIPFKAKQIVSEVLTQMTSEEISGIENKVEHLLMAGVYGSDNMVCKYLDEEVEKGGLGMDKRSAEKLAKKIKEIVGEIKILAEEEKKAQNKESNLDNEAVLIRNYLLKTFEIKIQSESTLKIIDGSIKGRLENKIDKKLFQKKLDCPIKKGGAGLDKRMAKKVAKRLELLILGKYE